MVDQVFVARERELAQLNGFLEKALSGQGQICFVTGEAGAGKTALVTEFARRAQAQHDDLLVAIGECNAQTGIGDPYLPFREVLGLLTGDVEARLSQGAITQENAGRLRAFLRISGQALVDLGPDLIDILVPGVGVATRAGAFLAGRVGWLDRLEALTERKSVTGSGAGLDQSRIFQQYTDVLTALAAQQPLILVLDDLHWVDVSSAGLLFHLARRIGENRILILGTYRPDDVALGRNGDRHPLEGIASELKRYHGDIWVDVSQSTDVEGRAFVDALLNAEPNRLGEGFRQALLRHTSGHPLFTVELLRDMRERGDLVQDKEGRWVEGAALDWGTLPARVRGVIEERIRRLEAGLQEALTVASVEGETFAAQVVARVCGVSERDLVRRLARDADRQHRLVWEQGIKRIGGRRLSIYRFRHNLFQRYLYRDLSETEREFLHEDVGNTLEALYGDQAEEIAVELARHFQAAGIPEKAIHYLYQAGNRAIRLSANDEAIAHLTRGLSLLGTLPVTPERSRQELDLRIALGEAQKNAGQILPAMETFQQAAGIARTADTAEHLARAALGFEEARWRFNLPAAPSVDLLEEALQALDEEDSVLRVRVLGGLVRALIANGTPAELEPMARQAVEAARRINDPLALSDALRIYLFANRQPERTDERIATVSEMLQVAEEIGDSERITEAYGSRIHEHLERGDIQAMEADLQVHAQFVDKLQQPFFLYTTAMFGTARALLHGHFEEGERLAQQALDIGQQMGVENADGTFGVQMFTIRREQGRLPEMAPVVKHFVERYDQATTWRPGLALIYSDLGMEPEARAEFEHLAADGFASLSQDALWVATVTYLAEVCAFLGDAERAATLYQLLLPYDGLNVVVGFAATCYGATSRYLGLLAATMSRWEEAERHFEDALEMNARMGARPWLAHTQHQYAAMLLARGQAGDRARATSLLDQALATAGELGMQALVEKVETLG
ncbi:MAG: AAA family ATPase [Anaerolineae bacterium]